MLLAIDGFDHYGASEAQAKGWSQPFPATMSPGRYGGQSANWTPFAASSDNRYPLSQPSNNNPIVGFAWSYANAAIESPIIALCDGGTTQCTLTWNGMDGKFRLRGGGGITGVVLGTSTIQNLTVASWHHLELSTVIDSAGDFSLKLDGTSVMTGTGNTQASATAQITRVAQPASLNVGGNCAMRYDDLYVIDTSGGMTTIGDQRVYLVKPASDGSHTEFAPSPSGTHYDKVNTTNLGGASYVASQTLNARDSFHGTQIPATAVVTGVQVCVAAYKTDAGARDLAALVVQGGTDYVGANVPLASSVQVGKTIFQNNPATSAAWTAAQVNADEFGAKVTL